LGEIVRRIASTLVSLMLFLSIIGFLSNLQTAKGSSTIYIRTDGSIEPSTADILTFDNITYVFTDNIYEGIVVERSNITLDGNGYNLKGSGTGIGILLSGEHNITIKGMTISDFAYGVSIDSPSNIISGNNITCKISINSAYNTISNNTLSNGITLVRLYGTATTIVNNDIENGIYLRGSQNKVYGNRITGLGIDCGEASSNNVIQRNLIFACRDAGIVLRAITYSMFPKYPTNNIIVENEIVHCPTGISLDSARSTTIYHNNLINNTNQVSGVGVYTTWDNDYPSGGNYWSDYVGTDLYSGLYQNETGADGIGDTPYLTNANDRYPLIERHNLTFWQTQRLNPKAQFTANIETSRPAAIFDASTSKPGWNGTYLAYIKEYTWQFGDGNTTSSTSASITHIYPSSGTYTISLTVKDQQDLKGSIFGHVYIVMPTTISIQTTTPSSPLGFKVGISGTLQNYYGNGLENQEIVAYYTFSGIDTWIPITSDFTDSVGDYAFEWIPSATGYFTISISWNGNVTHLGTNNTVSYALTAHEEYFIAVESNSTISELSFDVQNRTLIFKATGQNYTDSYTRVSIPKILVSDINKVEVFIDGVKISYNSELLQDSCIYEFIHTNSVHEIKIKLPWESSEQPLESSGFLGLDLWVWMIIVSAGIIVAITASILILKRRKS